MSCDSNKILEALTEVIESRNSEDAASSYVSQLLHADIDKVLKKIGEEAIETVLAAKSGNAEHTVKETADLWFHSMIMLQKMGLSAQDVLDELQRRFGVSGLEEKRQRFENQD